MAIATHLPCCPPRRENAPKARGERRLTSISAADWFSSAPGATSHFRSEALTSRRRLAERKAGVVGSHRLPRLESRSSSHRCRRKRPGWQRGWCRDGQPPPSHPLLLRPVSRAFPRRLVRPPLGRMPRRQAPLSRLERRYQHPGALVRSQDRNEPCLTKARGAATQRRLTTDKSHRSSTSLRPSNRDEPPRVSGFATGAPASDGPSRLYPRIARLSGASAVRRVPSATRRLSASATRCHPSTPTPRSTFDFARSKLPTRPMATTTRVIPAGLSQVRGPVAERAA